MMPPQKPLEVKSQRQECWTLPNSVIKMEERTSLPRSPLVPGMTRQPLSQRGHALIALGVFIILAAQLWSSLPVVAAIALIGRGAVLTLQQQPRTSRQDSLVVISLSIYGTLVCLAIVAQSNAVLQHASRVSLLMLLDHALAIVLSLGLVCSVFTRLSQPTM